MSLRDTLRRQIEEVERGALPLVAASPGEPIWVAKHRSDRDWTEDFGDENGWYINLCGDENTGCCLSFIGHKRRVLCKLCAKPAEGGTPSPNPCLYALYAVLEQCEREIDKCEDEKCAVCLAAACVIDRAENAFAASLRSVPEGKEERQ